MAESVGSLSVAAKQVFYESQYQVIPWQTGSMFGVALVLGGCGDAAMTPESEFNRAVAEAASAEAMWYRFTFQVDYKGSRVAFDQMIYCPRAYFSGGQFGQSTAYSIRQQQPMTIAKKMVDGSQILVRIPDMCKRHRNYKIPSGVQNGWRSVGPFDTLPYVIWSDTVPRPERIEAYVSSSYYGHPEARLKNPKGQVFLLPVGSHPKNYVAIVQQQHAIPYSPNPWIKPGKKDPSWMYRDGEYHDIDNQFISMYQVPIANLNEYIEKYRLIGVITEEDRVKTYEIDRTFSDRNIAKYKPETSSGADAVVKTRINDSDFVTHKCVSRAIDKILSGQPLSSNLPIELRDVNNRVTANTQIKEISNNDSQNKNNKIDSVQKIQDKCYDQLADLRSFEILNGRFDTSRSVPGVITYHRWGEIRPDSPKQDSELRYAPIKLQKMGLATPQGYKMTIEGHEFFDFIGMRGGIKLYENKNTRQWYMFQVKTHIYTGEGENNHF